jgi:hypothetical protein
MAKSSVSSYSRSRSNQKRSRKHYKKSVSSSEDKRKVFKNDRSGNKYKDEKPSFKIAIKYKP